MDVKKSKKKSKKKKRVQARSRGGKKAGLSQRVRLSCLGPGKIKRRAGLSQRVRPVSYTHLTLPTSSEV